MTIAKVTLTRGPLSHTHGSRKFVRRVSQTLTSLREIKYYENEYGFSVKYLGGPGHGTGGETKSVEKEVEVVEKKRRFYTEEQLGGKKKKKLEAIAGTLDIPLAGKEKKVELIDFIITAQNLLKEEEEE